MAGRAGEAAGGPEGGSRSFRGQLVEREGELAVLGGLLSTARNGGGRLLVIEGPAGIGKTRLLNEACARAAGLGLTALVARGGELERDFAFGVVRQLLEPTLTRADARERGRLLAGAAGLSGPVFGPTVEGTAGRDVTQSVLHGLYWLVANMAEGCPLLLAVDDVHWADGPSLRFLIYLASRLDGLPVALVVARRSGEDSTAEELLDVLVVSGSPPVLRPPGLTGDGVGQLVRDSLGPDTAEDLARACHHATQGNPFLLTELLHELQSERRPAMEHDPAVVGRLAVDRIAAAILLRVGRLGPSAPRFARAVAVLGEAADLELAAALADVEPAAAGPIADSLAQVGILERGRPLRFVHPIVRTAVYGEAAHAERAALHARAAQLLAESGAPLDSVAAHLLVTDPAGDERTVDRLRQAARAAMARGAPEAAVRYLRRAQRERSSSASQSELLLELGTAAARAGEDNAVDLLRQAFRLAEGQPARALAGLELSVALSASSTEPPEIIAVLEHALDGLDEPQLVRQLETLLAMLGTVVPRVRGRVAARISEARARAEESPPDALEPVLSPIAVDLAITGADASTVAKVAERALGDGELMRVDVATDSPVAMTAVWALVHAGRFGRVRHALDDGIKQARAGGSPFAVARISAFRALVYYSIGDLATAEADARTCLDLDAGANWGIPYTIAAAVLGNVLVYRGDLSGARAALDFDPDPAALELTPNQILRESRARLLMAEGEPNRALAELLRCRAWEVQGKLPPSVAPVPWRSAAALAQLRLGETGEAHELAQQGVELARAFGAPPQIGRALRSLGLVEGGEDGVRLLTEAVSALTNSGARLETAEALVSLGVLLRVAGKRMAAADQLRAGMDLAHRCGATALVEGARNELRLAGARPRRVVVSGRDALTPGERRVASLALEGMANKEIAQALFVTLRTVEMHLSNAYRKLGINSREQLAAALDHPATSEVTAASPDSARRASPNPA